MVNEKATDPQDVVADAPTAEESPTGGLSAAIEEQAARIAQLREEIAQQKTYFQNAEVSLVSRIADVDDDRRQAATRLQRTLQSHQDELEARYRRQNATVAASLLFFLVLVGGVLAFFYIKFDETRRTFAEQVTELKQALEQIQIPDAAVPDQATRDKLSQLSNAVKAISSSLTNLGDDQEKPVTPPAETQPPAPSVSTPAAEAPPPTETRVPEAPPQTSVTAPESEERDAESATEADRDAAAPAETGIPAEPPPEPKQADQTAPPRPTDEARSPTSSSGAAGTSASASLQNGTVGERRFSVQLMGFYSLDSLRKFANEEGAGEHFLYQEDTYQDRPWYVLIHSLHTSKEAAQTAVSRLPKELKKLEIWVRELDRDSIVHDLNAKND